MLKLSTLFLGILGLVTTTALPTSEGFSRLTKDFSTDWADFAALVPWDEVQEITAVYFDQDEEVRALAKYLESDDFKNVVLALEAIPEYMAFVDYLDAAGLDFYGVINAIRVFLGFEELPVPFGPRSVHGLKPPRITGGVSGFFADVKAVLPLDELRALYLEKLETSEAFATLMSEIASDEFQVIVNELKGNEEWQEHRAEVVANGLDVDALFALLRLLFGLDSAYSTSKGDGRLGD